MKIALIGSFPTCYGVYEWLSTNNHLIGVCFHKTASNNKFKNIVIQQGYPIFDITTDNITTTFKNWLTELSPDLIIVCGFGLKIPSILLEIPTYGFLNTHFGKLPDNRGADPIFWSLKNGDKETAITFHKINSHWDRGPILFQQNVSIIFGETADMLNSKMSLLSKEALEKTIALIPEASNYKTQSSDKLYPINKRPEESDYTINWETQTSEQIEFLVNASNSKYGGAITFYQGAVIKLLEVSPVDMQTPLFGKIPGEIIYAHPQEGLFVCCKYGQLLRINIINTDAGILTGTKYVNLGIQQGHRFNSNIKQTINI